MLSNFHNIRSTPNTGTIKLDLQAGCGFRYTHDCATLTKLLPWGELRRQQALSTKQLWYVPKVFSDDMVRSEDLLTILSIQSPNIAEFVNIAKTLPIPQLPQHFKAFPPRWPFPRGDLYHWIPLFNRFDHILEQFNSEYGLNVGPQVQPFGRAILLKGATEDGKSTTITPTSASDLDNLGYAKDGDRQLVEAILEFSRQLLENCGNRSLYASSERLGDLLNTTSLSLLTITLQLAVRLAQRYHASRSRGTNTSQHLNHTLLASHYNLDLEKVQRLANPFTKPLPSIAASSTAGTPTLKGKEKAQTSPSTLLSSINPNDLIALTQETTTSANGSTKHVPANEKNISHTSSWEDWGSVLLSYYQPSSVPKDDTKLTSTPTPIRRPSGLSRPSRMSSSDESPDASVAPPIGRSEEPTIGGMRQIEISHSRISSSAVEDIMKEALDNIPKDSRYELLTRVRIAHAMTSSIHMRHELVGIRLLALTNLAYIYPDVMFQQKILQQDSDEPRRLQLAYQLADLVHPPGNGKSGIPPKLQTLALGALEALAKQKAKAPDVCAALNINVNHGVLFYLLRKAVAEMALEEPDDADMDSEGEDRREAVFSLLDSLPSSSPRTGESLIAAGLLDILIEVLNMRTTRAERNHPKVLTFLNTLVYTVRDALQSLANSKGLETISNLIDYEVHSSLKRANNGEGLDPGYRNKVVDYQTPYFQQQTLRMLFKLINHMMTHSHGNFDRLLRNLIDSPQLLNGLKVVIVNAKIFGSSIWSGAINIMSSFIHNEPTSYAVISEAGLSSGLLEAISLKSRPQDPMSIYEDFAPDVSALSNTGSIAKFMHNEHCKNLRQATYPPAQEILPATDAIVSVPQAFGAICLHHTGLDLFVKSGALDSFFKIFENDEHIEAMVVEQDLLRLLGGSFDELVRHHPNLKTAVMINIMTMVERVSEQCRARAKKTGCGAKLWLQAEDNRLEPAGERDSTEPKESSGDIDVVMSDAPPISAVNPGTKIFQPEVFDETDEKHGPSTAMRIEMVMKFLEGFFENSSLCGFFVEASGSELVLDLATLPSLPFDFNLQNGGHELHKVIHIMVEQKPHLTLPSLLQRTQKTVDGLKPLYEYTGDDGFFSEFTSVDGVHAYPHAAVGTAMLKSLVNVHTMCSIFYEVFSSPIFTSRSSHTPFSQVNLADMYRNVIKGLGLLHRVCVWEEILLQKKLPEHWKKATKIKGWGMGGDEADAIFGFVNSDDGTSGDANNTSSDAIVNISASPRETASNFDSKKPDSPDVEKDEKTAQFKNVRTLRYVLSQVPSAVILFFQNLGKALVAKRRPEAYARQNAYLVAEAMSKANLEQLSYEPPRKTECVKDRYAYWIVILTSISSLMIEGTSVSKKRLLC